MERERESNEWYTIPLFLATLVMTVGSFGFALNEYSNGYTRKQVHDYVWSAFRNPPPARILYVAALPGMEAAYLLNEIIEPLK